MVSNLNNKTNVLGKYTYNNGDIYEGDFCDDLQNGFGTLTKVNGLNIQRYFQNSHVVFHVFFLKSYN